MSDYQPLYRYEHCKVARYCRIPHGIRPYEPPSHLVPPPAGSLFCLSLSKKKQKKKSRTDLHKDDIHFKSNQISLDEN